MMLYKEFVVTQGKLSTIFEVDQGANVGKFSHYKRSHYLFLPQIEIVEGVINWLIMNEIRACASQGPEIQCHIR